eukprot:TRINITY_DN97912_c0_g1_i1.p1 TRINITY_DN97912_c0_g1~~TRINITY_DN97912_c0_g1_i1.p1  ORF type:complete len:245 (-),score=47.44 TRINITY_DN97912_c0_g1_i1:184-918(-)
MAAFVSGGSRGIGLALVQGLLRRTSMDVIAAGRTALDSTALQALRAEHGSRLLPLAMNVADEASIKEAAAAAGSRVSLLIHSAAMMHPSGRGENGLSRLDHKAFTEVLATNVVGPALLTKELFSRLKSPIGEMPSKVVAIGAGVASVGTNQAGGWYSYRCSKTALNALMKNIAIEGARSNVTAFTLYPEMVGTALAKPYLKGNPYPQLRSPEETAAKMLDLIDRLGPADSGRFVNVWSEQDIPW